MQGLKSELAFIADTTRAFMQKCCHSAAVEILVKAANNRHIFTTAAAKYSVQDNSLFNIYMDQINTAFQPEEIILGDCSWMTQGFL